jgi:predicted ferric reductase
LSFPVPSSSFPPFSRFPVLFVSLSLSLIPHRPVPFAAYQQLGQGVAIARGCANVLKLNCAFILIPVLRNFLSILRGTWVNNYLPIDKNIVFHKYIGAWILIMVLAHVLAHYTNYNKVPF